VQVDGAAMSLLTATEARETLSVTDAIAATVEDLQFTLGEGACIEAAVNGRPVLVLAAVDTATVMLLGMSALPGHSDGHQPGGGGHGDGASGPAGREDGAWWDGLHSERAEVHQATGMIVAQLGIPAQDAFVRLRAYAFAHRRPLGDVARDVVARRLVFAEDMA
jgi:hypothetical protein